MFNVITIIIIIMIIIVVKFRTGCPANIPTATEKGNDMRKLCAIF